MKSLDITQSREGAAPAPYSPAFGIPCTRSLSQPQPTLLVDNKPEYHPPNDRGPVKLADSARASPYLGVGLSARNSDGVPENAGHGGGAQVPMDLRGESVFVDVPLSEEGEEASIVVVVWRWICEWVFGWGRVVGWNGDLEAGGRCE